MLSEFVFQYIPVELWPKESEHIDYDPVFRAVKSTELLTVNDFLPWNIEHRNQKKTFKTLFKQPEYGMSVFTELDSLMKKIDEIPSLKKHTKSVAKGRTSKARGISPKENQEHHVEYFLYDYINNSPKDDFEICTGLCDAT